MRASRVGVTTHPPDHHMRACSRCGVVRHLQSNAHAGRLCGDCRLVCKDLDEEETWQPP